MRASHLVHQALIILIAQQLIIPPPITHGVSNSDFTWQGTQLLQQESCNHVCFVSHLSSLNLLSEAETQEDMKGEEDT